MDDGEFLRREDPPHRCYLPRGERVGPGSVWRCRCGRRWILDGPNDNLMWRRTFWPWPR